jgi:hypothetical protein
MQLLLTALLSTILLLLLLLLLLLSQLMLHVAQPCFTCPHILPVSSTKGRVHHAAFTDAAAEDDYHILVHAQLYPALLETLAPGGS